MSSLQGNLELLSAVADLKAQVRKLRAELCNLQNTCCNDLTFNNGLTRTGFNTQLGGTLIKNTTIGWDFLDYNFIFGDVTGDFLAIGNSAGSSILSTNTDKIIFTTNAEASINIGTDLNLISGEQNSIQAGSNSGTYESFFQGDTNLSLGIKPGTTIVRQLDQNYQFGYAHYDDETSERVSNIFYGKLDINNAITDLIRSQVQYNYLTPSNSTIHSRIYTNFTTPVNYCGFIATQVKSQLEYNTSNGIDGSILKIDTNGFTASVASTKVFRINNSVQEFTDNAAALLGGLTSGDIYRTNDILKIVH